MKAGPNTYMEVLVKETVTLHKVLSKYLAEQSVEVRDMGPSREGGNTESRYLFSLS